MNNTDRRVVAIEQRNAKVETDKAWEISLTRRVLIAGFTYLSIFAYGVAIDARSPALNAVIPTAGFLLSTLTLPAVKRRWAAKQKLTRNNLETEN